jgi:ribonuclease HII
VTVRPDLEVERAVFDRGAKLVAGIDEVGRGAWAGPVSVGVVMIDRDAGEQPSKLRDSKLIAASVRRMLVPQITGWALEATVGHATASECDLLGMRGAVALAASRALDQLHAVPDLVIVDGPQDLLASDAPMLGALVAGHRWRAAPPMVETVVKGDQRCASVAAASVVAKVARDELMSELAPSFPGFDFDKNVGYPSQTHQRALRGYGLTVLHRRSWRFVESIAWQAGSSPEAVSKDR